MGRLVATIDVINLEPTKTLIEEIERVIEMKENGCSYKHAWKVLMTEYAVFKASIERRCTDSEVKP